MSITNPRSLLLLLLLLGPPSFSANPDVLLPLSVGSQWKYINVDNRKDKPVIKVEQSQEMVGKTWYAVNKFGELTWVGNTEAGVFDAGKGIEGKVTAYDVRHAKLLFQPPGEFRQGNYSVCPETPEDCGTIRFEKLSEPCKVPAGKFNCIRYQLIDSDKEWLVAPGVGILEINEDGKRYALRKYKLKTPK